MLWDRSTRRVVAFTGAALLGFASNSLFCRAALGSASIDAASFTCVRIAAGALTLAVLFGLQQRRLPRGGSWTSALALFVYAAAFSFAYVRIAAGIGALILFGAVQTSMLGWGLATGERPSVREWSGLGLAVCGIGVVAWPGVSAPDALGAILMAGAGIAWAVYTLRGRTSRAPLGSTADNFLRCLPLAALLSVSRLTSTNVSARGIALAVGSGALASGLGYSLWYAALPHLSATRAAIVQLCVPALTALGGVVLLGESLSVRVAAAGLAIIGGVSFAVLGTRSPA